MFLIFDFTEVMNLTLTMICKELDGILISIGRMERWKKFALIHLTPASKAKDKLKDFLGNATKQLTAGKLMYELDKPFSVWQSCFDMAAENSGLGRIIEAHVRWEECFLYPHCQLHVMSTDQINLAQKDNNYHPIGTKYPLKGVKHYGCLFHAVQLHEGKGRCYTPQHVWRGHIILSGHMAHQPYCTYFLYVTSTIFFISKFLCLIYK